MTFTGYGSTTLSGASNYTGTTNVTGGYVAITNTASAFASSQINVSNYATLIVSGTVSGAVSLNNSNLIVSGSVGGATTASNYSNIQVSGTMGAVHLDNVTLSGSGTLGATTVTSSYSNYIGNATTAAPLTVSSLAFGGTAYTALTLSQATPTAVGLVVTGALSTTPANGTVYLNLATDTGLWTSGVVDLIHFGSFSGSTTDFAVNSINLIGRQTSGGIVLDGNNIALQINGENPKWTGLDSNIWSDNLTGPNHNWKLLTSGTPTDFLTYDVVYFDDSNTSFTNIELGDYVYPAGVYVNNSTLNYTLSSSSGYYIAFGFLSKAGSGILTMNLNNSYTSGTTFTGGLINIGSAGALGNGALKINAGLAKSLDNTTGGSITLTTITQSDNNSFTGSLIDGGGTGLLGFSKSGIGTVTLSNTNNYSDVTTLNGGRLVITGPNLGAGTNVAINGTTSFLVLGNTSALGANSRVGFNANSISTLDIALDGGSDLPNVYFGTSSSSTVTLSSDRATAGAGVNHILGNASVNSFGGGIINVIGGANVTSGKGTLTLGTLGLAAGSTQTSTLNPTTANLVVAAALNNSNNTHLLELSGMANATMNGDITATTGTMAVLKSLAGTWTLLGNSNYNGTTSVAAGVLNIGNGGTTGTLPAGAVANSATININRSDAVTIGSAFSGAGIINKNNGGTATLTGVSSFSGTTNINLGKLSMNGSMTASAMALVSGTLDGTGLGGAVTVTSNPTNTVTNGNGGAGALTLRSLTFNGSASLNILTTAGASGLIVAGTMTTTPASGVVTVNPTTTTGLWADGFNNLVSYGTLAGAIGNFSLGTSTGTLGPRQTYGGLALNGTKLALVVNGDTPKWTGALAGGAWTTNVLAAPKNWQLITTGTPADYLQTTVGDNVIFDDSATGSTNVNIKRPNHHLRWRAELLRRRCP